MKIREIIGALEHFAPLSLQDSYDNAGLQIGLTEDAEASGVLLCLDVTEAVIDEACRRGCNLVVSHHPLLFRPPRHITGEDYVQRTVIRAIQKGVWVYSAHTNLDNAPGGVSWRMAEKLGLLNVSTLEPASETENGVAGAGVVGELPDALSCAEFVELLGRVFGVEAVRHNEWRGQTISRVALCGGAGAFLADKAKRAGAQAFVTGEVGYHRFFGYEDDLMVVELGHYESERYTIGLLQEIIAKAVNGAVPVLETELMTNPVVTTVKK